MNLPLMEIIFNKKADAYCAGSGIEGEPNRWKAAAHTGRKALTP